MSDTKPIQGVLADPSDVLWRNLRLEKGWTQKELAKRSGESQQSIARWEMGTAIPLFDSGLGFVQSPWH